MVSASDFLEYYRSLDSMYTKIETLLGEVDTCISSFDYYLRAGATEALANYHYK